jgi:hypothetical protein
MLRHALVRLSNLQWKRNALYFQISVLELTLGLEPFQGI